MNDGRQVGTRSLRVAFGPEMPRWGSWEWVGRDMCAALSTVFDTRAFGPGCQPDGDVIVIVKHLPSIADLRQWAEQAAIIYCPIDGFECGGDIDRAAPALRLCSRIVVHCHRLAKYVGQYAACTYMDHHLKFVSPRMASYRSDGFVLWTGVRSNLPALETWLTEHTVPRPLLVLTNFDESQAGPPPLRTGANQVRLEDWSAVLHLRYLVEATAALDIKGMDFRSQHKPPAKALDFLGSGVPLAMNRDSSSAEHLAALGFELACPDETDRWFSRDYWRSTRRFGRALRELLSRHRVAYRWQQLIEEAWSQRRLQLSEDQRRP